MGHHQEENLILHVSKCPIYILHCAKTCTIMVSCGGFIAKLTESRNLFAAWFYQKCKFKTREDLLSRIMLGDGGDGDGVRT